MTNEKQAKAKTLVVGGNMTTISLEEEENRSLSYELPDNFVVLENVKSVICSRSGILYPTNRYGVPDIEEGIHYDGIRDGFGMYPDYLRKNLSETDREIIDGVFDEMARRFARSRGL